MRAIEILKEVDTLGHNSLGVGGSGGDMVTITVPRHMLNIKGGESQGHDTSDEPCCNECGLYEDDCMCDESMEVDVDTSGPDELDDIVRLAGSNKGTNCTIAAAAGSEVPTKPVFISPLQQELELQKQQGGKESLVINQIIDDSALGSTAGEQPEQSVYHDSPLKDNEYVGAGTGAVDHLENSTTTKGATKPWYKL